MKPNLATAVAHGAAAAHVLSEYSGDDAGGDSRTIKVADRKFGTTCMQPDGHMKNVMKAFEAEHNASRCSSCRSRHSRTTTSPSSRS